MRLLHSPTIELREFFENATPTYAILSHTWEQEEVTYQDMQGQNAKAKAGYTKIQKCCEQATRDRIDFVWIDTCCIDKSSSAELSEAINSMYRWYEKAKTCYAYLVDVAQVTTTESARMSPKDILEATSFHKSRWFTRGWTLQELIAPTEVQFFACDWTPLGTKEDLKSVLATVTGIDEATLTGRDMREVSVAKRMSWASKRITTRTEDIAYCLVGIFGVNLPLLYGEGERAFVRLQEEIMKNSDDQSLFAWKHDLSTEKSKSEPQEDPPYFRAQPRTLRGFLARSPAEFENSGNIIPFRNWEVSMPYSMTNQGLRMELPVIQHKGYDDYTAILACHFEDNFLGPLGIYIQPVASPQADQFARDVSHLQPVIVVPQHVAQAQLRTVYIRQDVLLPTTRDFDRRDHFLIRTLPDEEYKLLEVHPTECWSASQKIIRCPDGSDGLGALLFKSLTVEKSFAVIVRSKVLQGGSENNRSDSHDPYHCSCSIVVDPRTYSEGRSWKRIVDLSPAKLSEGTYTHADLNPRDDLNKDREIAFARIGREAFMGQLMFVVDIGVQSARLKISPFFAKKAMLDASRPS